MRLEHPGRARIYGVRGAGALDGPRRLGVCGPANGRRYRYALRPMRGAWAAGGRR